MASNRFIPISDLPILPGSPSETAEIPVQAAGVTYKLRGRQLPLVTDTFLTWGDQYAALPFSRQLEAGPGVVLDTSVPGKMRLVVALAGIPIVFDQIATAGISGTNQDWNNFSWASGLGKSRLQLIPDSSAVIGGLESSDVVDGQAVALMNESSTEMLQINHNDAGSIAPNRFFCPGGADFVLLPLQCIFLLYQDGRGWRMFT